MVKPGGKVSARVLFDGTHGLCVNSKTRLRDQERAPIAADLKRSMREKSRIGELTFALSADVTEAHRQVPIHPDDWHLLGCQVSPGGDVFINTVGTFGIASASYYWSRAQRLLVDLSSISPRTPRRPGICSSQTTIYWSQEAPNIALVCCYSSCCVLLLACLYLGTKPVEVTRWSGLVSSCYFALAVLGSRLEELSGSSVGLRQLPVQRRFTWGHLKRGSVVSCL